MAGVEVVLFTFATDELSDEQEVTSKKDQRQFWNGKPRAYRYVSVSEFADAFRDFHVGKTVAELRHPERTEQGSCLTLKPDSLIMTNTRNLLRIEA